ncbi:TonB-dependent receptor [Lysobacter gummosus]|uniref:TonB-dependent receptor n=1 Tax=Lysobacter gummosus TaxID=262324 RepID=A0ABY3XCB5_9GAMM|nr:TonB-dependent receptor [Lysobacter gummosus]ALN92534.1 carboxypeptidase regulatory-like domain protein [Lysobacter gummosus]UNP28115.1 TonB-dependent receptor [Lysobacter gummosus]
MTHQNRVRMSKLALGLLAVLATAPVFAQSTSAGIAGRVVGADGQPVQNAEVTITHTESGTVSRATTGADGRYNARGLRVGGPYTVVINKEGGGTASQDGVYLNLDKVNEVDVSLNNSVTTLESVQAVAAAASEVFSANKMGAGSVVTRQQLEQMPTINRNLQDFVRLDPRVVQTDKSRNEISVGGQNPRYNVIRVDGVSTNDSFGLGGNGLPTPKQPFSMDVIDEVSIDVANYDVTIAGGTGGVINAVTKSGTNDFHGSLYGIYRDNDWSGKNSANSRPQLFDNESTYGGTFGGPLIKDKLFFFANYEKYTGKEVFTGNSSFGPPGSGANNTVNISQAQINEIIDISKNVWGFDPGTLSLPSLDTKSEEYGLKIDWNISDRHRANFRYAQSKQSTAFLQGFGSNSLALSSYHYVQDFEFKTYTAQLFSDWTDNFSTEAKVSYRDYSAVRNPQFDLPAIGVRVGSNTLNFGTEENTQANVLETKTWNGFFAGNLFLDAHTLKFGADYESNEVYNLFGRRINGAYTFNSIADYRTGRSGRYQLFAPRGGDLDNMAAGFTQKNLGLFVQDSWAVNDRLTLTFGVRYDRAMVDEKPTFNPAASALFGVNNSNTIDGSDLWQPRFGFNYTFDSERPTQLRGGIGLFKGGSPTVWLANPYSNNGVSYTDYFFPNGITRFSPNPDAQLGLFNPGTGGQQSVDFIEKDLSLPSVWKANLAFDTELPWYGMVAAIEGVVTKVEDALYYQQLNLGSARRVGQDGRNIYWNDAGLSPLSWNQDGTACLRETGTAGGPACVSSGTNARAGRSTLYNDAIIARNTSKGESQQLTISLNKPFNNSDWAWGVAYTFTHATEVSPLTSSTSSSQLGNVGVFQANEEVAARSAYEIRDRFTANVNWKHAFFGDYNTIVSLVYEGRSGRPYSYAFDNDANGDGRLNDLLYIPKGVGDVVFRNPAEQQAFWNYVNGNEYLRSHLGQVAERNDVRGKWVNQFDLHIAQELPGFWEGHKAELAVDIMNVGNLLNKKWGRVEEVAFPGMRGVVEYGGVDPATGKYVYRFNTPDPEQIYDEKGISRWAAQVSFRYRF